MRHRRLGSTGYEVSEIGFGGWGLGGTMWLGVPEEQSRKAIVEALERGVNFFDTALAYGDGHSEQVLRQALSREHLQGRVLIATKIPPKNRVWPGDGTSALSNAFPADHVRDCVEASLRNLGAGWLDLEQLHVWHDNWLESPDWERTRAIMERLKREGKVRHWGVSVNDHAPETALRLLADPLVETVQVIYNIFDRSPERDLFSLAQSRDLGVIIRVPFDEGALTGQITASTAFPGGDWRERYFRGARKQEVEERVRPLEGLLGSEARTLPELSLRFCLSRPEVSTVIPGMRRPEHARVNAAASDGRALSKSLLARLADHAWEKNWYA